MRQFSSVAFVLIRGMTGALSVLMGSFQDVRRYHPERHYMRGPGPKWRKKHFSRAVSGRN
jgi:hypothetical protein